MPNTLKNQAAADLPALRDWPTTSYKDAVKAYNASPDYKDFHWQRIFESNLPDDVEDDLYNRNAELNGGDFYGPLHPDIIKELPPVIVSVGDSETFNADLITSAINRRMEREGKVLDMKTAARRAKSADPKLRAEAAAYYAWVRALESPEATPAAEAPALKDTEDNPYVDALISCADFQHIKIPKKKYLLFPFLWSGSYGIVTGARGVSKTWFALGMSDAITRGVAFGPWECHEPASVIYLEAEMSLNDDTERIEAMGLSSDRARPLYLLSNAYVTEILQKPVIHLTDELTRKYLKELILDNHIDVVFFDNIASLTPGVDENSKMEWDAVNQFMIGLRYAGVSPWLIHHTGKSGDQRGTSGREDNVDVSIKLIPPRDYQPIDGARFITTFNKQRISHKHLPLLIDREMRYQPDDNGNYTWTFGDPDRDNLLAVLDKLIHFYQQKDIAKELNLSKGQVSKLRTQLSQKGLIDQNNLLTEAGKNALIHGGYEVET